MKWSGGWNCTAVGAILIDDVAAASPTPGTINLFGIGTTNAVFVQTYSGGQWGRWTSLGGNIRSKPSAVAFGGSASAVAVQKSRQFRRRERTARTRREVERLGADWQSVHSYADAGVPSSRQHQHALVCAQWGGKPGPPNQEHCL